MLKKNHTQSQIGATFFDFVGELGNAIADTGRDMQEIHRIIVCNGKISQPVKVDLPDMLGPVNNTTLC